MAAYLEKHPKASTDEIKPELGLEDGRIMGAQKRRLAANLKAQARSNTLTSPAIRSPEPRLSSPEPDRDWPGGPESQIMVE